MAESQPVRFSVIIPTLNEEHFLPQLLQSLHHQTDKHFEVIVVDGRSKDKTVEKANIFKEHLQHLSVVVSPKASLPLQRNLGAKQATGEWLAFVDADSVLMPYFFERIGKFLDAHKSDVIASWCQPDSDKPGEALIALFANMMIEGSLIFKRPFTPGPLTLVRRAVFESVGGYDESHKYHEDVDFGLRLHQKGVNPDVIRETLYVWSLRRIRTENKLKVLQQYLISAIPILFLNTSMKYMPGYTMGGQLYDKKKRPIKRLTLRKYELKVKKLVKELFE